jgi:HopA1 effector protein family
MPLLNPKNQSPDTFDMPLTQVLEDIAAHIRIQANLGISHPHYDLLELRPEISNSLQALSIALQDQYLRFRLGNYLYSIYDSGGDLSRLAPDSENGPIQSRPALNMALGVKSSFYTALHDQNTGEGYFDPDWLVLREASDGLLAVQKDGLTLHVSRDRHLAQAHRSAEIEDRVAVRFPRNLLEDHCYVAVGNAGPALTSDRPEDDPLIHIYFNLNAESIIALMKDLTTALNSLDVPFKFRVPLDETDCDRPDVVSLTFNKAHYRAIQPLLGGIYQRHQAQYRPKTPFFTKFLAPGLALAEQPRQPFTVQESFSLNRYQIVAEGLLTAWRQQNNDPAERMSAIRQSFAAHSINLNCPYLNAGSEDLSW